MEIPRIHIDSVDARIGIQQERPPMQMEQPAAEVKMSSSLAGAFEIEQRGAELSIDQSAAFADAGLIGPLQRTAEHAARAQQTVMQYVAETARHGEMLKRIEDGHDAIPIIAREKGTRPEKAVNYGQVPSGTEKVQVSVQTHDVDFRIDRSEPEIHVETNEVELDIPRWEAQTYLEQQNQIHFSVVGGKVNRQL